MRGECKVPYGECYQTDSATNMRHSDENAGRKTNFDFKMKSNKHKGSNEIRIWNCRTNKRSHNRQNRTRQETKRQEQEKKRNKERRKERQSHVYEVQEHY